jgi:hypothetical protein
LKHAMQVSRQNSPIPHKLPRGGAHSTARAAFRQKAVTAEP